jgi:hypothetical protein
MQSTTTYSISLAYVDEPLRPNPRHQIAMTMRLPQLRHQATF